LKKRAMSKVRQIRFRAYRPMARATTKYRRSDTGDESSAEENGVRDGQPDLEAQWPISPNLSSPETQEDRYIIKKRRSRRSNGTN
jgi:hypothetical protein